MEPIQKGETLQGAKGLQRVWRAWGVLIAGVYNIYKPGHRHEMVVQLTDTQKKAVYLR